MKAVNGRKTTVRGIIHCHSNLSYDSKVPLAQLCAALRNEGFGFVALTEHAQTVTEEDYRRFIADCKDQSDASFVAIPGLEVRCNDGIEIACVGVREIVHSGSPGKVVARVRELGGYAIWVHPLKRGRWPGKFLDCDAVEVLNGKVDGTVSPNFALLRDFRKHRQTEGRVHAIFGIDLHDLETPREIWIEVEPAALTAADVLEALREGRFVSRVARGEVSSTGEVTLGQFLSMKAMRAGYVGWNSLRSAMPKPLKKSIDALGRPLVRLAKKRRK
jgi:hypothetical protein